MARASTKEAEGAAFRLDPSPFGNSELRKTWQDKAEALGNLPEALNELVAFRKGVADDSLRDQDALWIEARLEERVAVLRFESMTNDEIRSNTLHGERTDEVCADFVARAEANKNDPRELERIAKEFRDRYKPPIMMSAPFMRTETVLAEFLMKARTLDWYDTPLEDLRDQRGVVVHKGGD